MSQPNANAGANKRLPALNKSKAAPSKNKGGNAVVLEMLASKMADLDRQQNEEAFVVALSALQPNPDQPRQIRDDERDQELAEDVKTRGILQPILVRPLKNGQYEIVAGERRYKAATLAGLKEVPVIIKEYNDEQARYAAMVENIQRQDLDPLDEGRFYDYLNIQENIGVRDIATYIHRSHKYVQDRLTRYREAIATANSAPVNSDLSSTGEDSDENHKRNQKLHKLQKSQLRRAAPTKTIFRFRDFLDETQQRIGELEQEERVQLAEHLRELRRQMETIEFALIGED
ncbi:MAG TPA: ParB/RepB/Spo0J family partition protein [Chloroflexia bacterium]|nr:ParB/RepB/Spo0J family partition protein [Chloroflexia bacterium]